MSRLRARVRVCKRETNAALVARPETTAARNMNVIQNIMHINGTDNFLLILINLYNLHIYAFHFMDADLHSKDYQHFNGHGESHIYFGQTYYYMIILMILINK